MTVSKIGISEHYISTTLSVEISSVESFAGKKYSSVKISTDKVLEMVIPKKYYN